MARQKATIVQIKGSAFVGIVTKHPYTGHAEHRSEWAGIATEIASDAFIPTPEPLTPEEPTERHISLKELLSEVDAILNPKPRVNTSKEICGHHYDGHPKCPETNWDAPAVTEWRRYMQRKSDERMAYLKERNGGAAC